jgi:hypothetical protein
MNTKQVDILLRLAMKQPVIYAALNMHRQDPFAHKLDDVLIAVISVLADENDALSAKFAEYVARHGVGAT